MSSVDQSVLSRYHRQILAKLEELGLEVDTIRVKHHVVVAGTLNGQPFRWTAGKTPSRSSYRVMLADLRRSVRQCGLEPPPLPVKGIQHGATPSEALLCLIADAEEFLDGEPLTSGSGG